MEGQITDTAMLHGDADPAPDDLPMNQMTSDIRERLQAFFFDGHVLECVSSESVERGMVGSRIDNESANRTVAAGDE